LHFYRAIGIDEGGRQDEPPNKTTRIGVTDHKAEGQRVLELVHLLIRIKADFTLFCFWFSVCILVFR